MVSEELINVVRNNRDLIDNTVDHKRDFRLNYFGLKTLERSYLTMRNSTVWERPQHMFMRVSVGIHGADLDAAFEIFNLLSEKWFTHASPTLFNAGAPIPRMSSCFRLIMKDDSIEGIYDILKQCALISKCAGGIGPNVYCIRSRGTFIAGTNGLVPMFCVQQYGAIR